MLHEPVRLGGLALLCALATSTLVLVAFLASSLVLSVVGGLGGIGSTAADAAPAAEPSAAAVLLSAERATDEECDEGRGPDREARRDHPRLPGEHDRSRDSDRCAEQRASDEAGRP